MNSFTQLGIFLAASFITVFAHAQTGSNTSSSVDDILVKYVAGFPLVQPSYIKYEGKTEYTDTASCVKEVNTVRQHHYAAFALSSGAGIGYFIIAKKAIDLSLKQETKKFRQINSELEEASQYSFDKHGSAAETASDIRNMSVETRRFQEGYKNLEKWAETLDKNSPVTKSLVEDMQKLKSKFDAIENGAKKSEKLGEQYRSLKLTKANPTEIESVRAAMESQSRANIRNLAEANDLFSKSISGKVIGVSYRTNLSEQKIYNNIKIQEEKSFANTKMNARLGTAASLVEGAIPGIVISGVLNMTDETLRSLASIPEILNEHNDAKFICSTVTGASKETQTEFKKNMSVLKTNCYIDDGKIVRAGHSSPTETPSNEMGAH